MNEAHNREARAGSVADRAPTTIRVPAEDLAGEAQAAQSVRARGKLYAARGIWKMSAQWASVLMLARRARS
jgi:hypothetical protein